MDNVNPSHYSSKAISCVDILESTFTNECLVGFYTGNIIKYVYRYRNKNGLEDLKKAEWYLNRLITDALLGPSPKDADELVKIKKEISEILEDDEYHDFWDLNVIVEGELDPVINSNILNVVYKVLRYSKLINRYANRYGTTILADKMLYPALESLGIVITRLEMAINNEKDK